MSEAMKKYISVIPVLAAALLFAGCEHNLDNNMVDDAIEFPGTERIIEISLFNESYTGSIIKSGKGFSEAIVKLGACTEEEVAAIDPACGYNVISSLNFSISDLAFTFAKDEVRKTFEVSWNLDDVFHAMAGKESIIPLKLYESTIGINEAQSYLFIKPVVSTVGIKDKVAQEASALCIRNIYPEANYLTRVDKGYTTLEMDMAVSGRDVEAVVGIDNSYIPAINKALGAEFIAAPEGLVTIENENVAIKAGTTGADINYSINYSVLFDENGEFKYEQDFVVPVVIKSLSPSTLYQSNRYAYFVFNMSATNVVKPPVGVDPVPIMGPGWELIAGDENSMDGDPNIESDWYLGRYSGKYLCDGDFSWPDGAFCTWFWTAPKFPLEFVFDTGEEHIWDKFFKVDSQSYQGQFREFEVWVAREYLETGTEWVLAAKGNTGYNGWQAFSVANIDKFTYEIPFKQYTRGRYVKFVIVESSHSYDTDNPRGGGYLGEFYGQGW